MNNYVPLTHNQETIALNLNHPFDVTSIEYHQPSDVRGQEQSKALYVSNQEGRGREVVTQQHF